MPVKMTRALFVLLCLLSGVVAAQSPGRVEVEMPVAFSDVLALDTRAPDLRVSYGTHPSQNATLWLPPGQDRQARPLLVLVHGGCWLEQYSAGHVFPLAQRLARDGYAVWVPEYRRVGEKGGGWPGTAADIVRSLDALVDVAEPRIDLDKAIVLGHSAGGHLALWLAARDPALLPEGLELIGAIGLAPITDLAAYARGGNSCEAVTPRFLGGAPEELPELYRQASPSEQPLRVPTMVLRGSLDNIVGAAQAEAMTGARLLELPGAAHFDWVHPGTGAYGVLKESIFDALQSAM